ncbi:tetratricopeptide repeat protein [Rufibacter sp. LB8]|uniref:type IX secretion system periplasmic lipoprotein PorW/SprE n=1 Tax=Rufibacter sp. LB8 TaxID=2777781 RepID=UPI00178C1D33|nr:tetratricopeptide repeat protein [Rufibacter sp. LB8]
MRRARFLIYFLLLAVVAGCAPDKPFGKFYHNVNARFNGYFLAREKMREAEAKMDAALVNDYNRVLDILPPLDTTFLKTLKPDLEEAIKRASFAIARHPKSRWVDDSYVVVGKARYYLGEDSEAIKTFRFVQTTSPDRHARHEALVWLMRVYIRQKDYDAAISVSELFRKERMNEENGRELLLTRAHLASLQNDLPTTIQNMEQAVAYADKKDQEARLRFILGQLYMATNQDQKAYEQFTLVLKKKPPYELDFYTKLNQAQVTNLKDVTDRARVEQFLLALASDEKNKEYLDKIYYDLAKLELRQKEYRESLTYLGQSTKASTTNRNQKAYSYLLAAQIHYDHLQQYKLSQAYYDSTLQILPPTTLGYEELADRKTVLTAFVQQLEIIRTEDSLQALAGLSDTERAARVAQQITQEKEAADAAALAASTARNTTGAAGASGPPVAGPAGTWYFDNPVVMANARNDFLRVWGDRPLQDNWRRSAALALGGGQQAGPATSAGADTAGVAAAAAQKQQQYLAAIPLNAEQLAASNQRLEEAYFTLGNIYQQRLREPQQATQTFLKLLERFPQSKHAPEVYYSLFVLAQSMQQNEQAATYARILKERFPTSKYSRLIENPDFLRTFSVENAAAYALYDSAYVRYEKANYPQALGFLTSLSEKYPQNDIQDQIAFLRVLVVGRTQPGPPFRAAVEQFMQTYKESPLLPKAKELLTVNQKFESGEFAKKAVEEPPLRPEEMVLEAPSYQANLTAPHAFVIVQTADTAATRLLLNSYTQYNSKFHPRKNLTLETQPLADSTRLLVVQAFPDYKGAQQYAKLQTARSSPLAAGNGPKFVTFVISATNLRLLLQLKNLEEYIAFFEKNYQ